MHADCAALDLIFDLDTNKKAIIRDEGATLTCQATLLEKRCCCNTFWGACSNVYI